MSDDLNISEASVATRARFDKIRYAQVWEDADVLLDGLRIRPGETVVSVTSAGDNVLALLTADPGRVIACDISEPQIHCLRLRIAAFRSLEHPELLELIGSRPSDRRSQLLDRALASAPESTGRFFEPLRTRVVLYGLGGVGKFERYLRLFQSVVLPLVHGRETVARLFTLEDQPSRERFYHQVWNNRRWRVLMAAFFSRRVMGWLGRDPAFFEHVSGSVSRHIAARTRDALVELEPGNNPYLHWILTRRHGEVLPCYLRPGNFDVIRSRLERIEIRHGPLGGESWDVAADAYNLSDIFEYMSPDDFARNFERIAAKARPGARLVYWNMMAPRGVPNANREHVSRNGPLESQLKTRDRAFFYSDLVVAEVGPCSIRH